MNILNQIAKKSLKLNKKRTISTVIGIVLSCSLICAVATMITSFKQTLVQNTINESGYYHLELFNVNDENIKNLRNNRDIKDLWTINQNGYAKLEGSKNEYKPYMKLYSMDKTSFENLEFDLIEGIFPSNSNEIVISNHIMKNGKVNYKIGDKIKIEVGERANLDGEILNEGNTYIEENEKLINTESHEFTIVGIIERPEYAFENYSETGYTVITTGINKGEKRAFISLKKPKEYKEAICGILGASEYKDVTSKKEKLKYDDFKVNEELLKWEVFAFSNETVAMLYSVAGVVIFIIIFTSVFCIRNSFAIATTEKMKMYGMLASVGATKKQIKKNVIFESLMYGIIRNTIRYNIWNFSCIYINTNCKCINWGILIR